MKLAIMQPYFFPYIGYFQLIHAVDKLVFYDDVNYIKGGWINRNRLFLSGAVRYITVPLAGASSFEKINSTKIGNEGNWQKQMLAVIHQSYDRAPYYGAVIDLVERVINSHDGCIASLAKNSIVAVSEYLSVDTSFVNSSSVYRNQDLRGAARVLDICNKENAKQYWNVPGGRDLYSPDEFKAAGVDLQFVDVAIVPYKQLAPDFNPGLSIIDVMMHNDKEVVKEMIQARGTSR